MAGSAHSSPSSTQSRKPGSGRPIEPGAQRLPDRHPRERAGLGLAVAVVHARRRPRRASVSTTSGLSGSPAATAWRRPGSGRRPHALGDRPVLGGRHAEHVDALALDHLQPLRRVEAGVVQQRRRRPRSQGAMNTLRADFDQPLAAVHQQRSPSRAPNQCSACTRWPAQVALAVADRLRLAGGAGGEHDQRGVLGRQVGGGRGRGLEQALVGHPEQRARRSRPPRRWRRRARRRSPARGSTASMRAPQVARRAAARCRGARRRRCGSRPPAPAPTRAGCRSPSSPRRRGRRRARPACRPAAPTGRRPRRR